MKIYSTIFKYELKKILCRKIVVIAFALCLTLSLLGITLDFIHEYAMNFKGTYAEYNSIRQDIENNEALSGRAVDQELIEEVIDAYHHIPEDKLDWYVSTEEYYTFARPYCEILSFMASAMRISNAEVISSWVPDENDLYERWSAELDEMWENAVLSTGEINYRKEMLTKIERPIVYYEHSSYTQLCNNLQAMWLFLFIFITIGLAGIFADEHARRTDALILSSSIGRVKTYLIKMAVGACFAAVSTLIFIVCNIAAAFAIYGHGGFKAPFQFIYEMNSDPITCGQAMIYAYILLFVAAIVFGCLMMLFSNLLRSSTATLATGMALLFAGLIFNSRGSYRIISQIWTWSPLCICTMRDTFDCYTLPLFGRYFASWQAVPVIYAILCIGIVFIGLPVYKNYQVSGR